MKAIGENKRCSRCHEWKHVSAYHSAGPSSPERWACMCKACKKEEVYRKYWETPEKFREATRRSNSKPENREKRRAYQKIYHVENREKVLAQKKRHREETKEQRAEYARKYANSARGAEARHRASVKQAERYRWMKEKLAELGLRV